MTAFDDTSTLRRWHLPTANLDALSKAWVKFLPRDAKSSSFTFVVQTGGGPLPCKLKIAFHYYFELARYGYAGDSLAEVLRSFTNGSDPFPAHPGAVFEEGSLAVKTIAPGYSRADALARLTPILRAAFPASTTPATSAPTSNREKAARTTSTRQKAARATAKRAKSARATANRAKSARATAKRAKPARATATSRRKR